MTDLQQMTPVQRHGRVFAKREDLFVLYGVAGSKVRQALALLDAGPPGHGLVGFGGRRSNTAAALAAACRKRKRGCRFHTAAGPDTPELRLATELKADIERHKPGYLSVLESRARKDGQSLRWPVGLQHGACVDATAVQTDNIPDAAKRIVVPIGAGVSLAGILRGCRQNQIHVPIVGVLVGADPPKPFLDRAAPGWKRRVELVRSPMRYDEECDERLGGVRLDPLYEAKCVPFLQPGDLLWVSGCRNRED